MIPLLNRRTDDPNGEITALHRETNSRVIVEAAMIKNVNDLGPSLFRQD